MTGDSFRAYWDVGAGASGAVGGVAPGRVGFVRRSWNQAIAFLLFAPGEYEIGVTGKYWTSTDSLAPYRTVTATASVEVAAPQFVILAGAAVGGLMAFAVAIVLRSRREQAAAAAAARAAGGSGAASVSRATRASGGPAFLRRLLGFLMAAPGYVLLSIVITILLARISDTQFFITVTVNDFWGAIAIGFMAGYAGERFLNRLSEE